MSDYRIHGIRDLLSLILLVLALAVPIALMSYAITVGLTT